VIAEACQGMTLLTGGSAVAMPLPAIWLRWGQRYLVCRWPWAGRDIAAPGDCAFGQLLGDDARAGGGLWRCVRRTCGSTLSRWPNMGHGAR
jgi:hypothetical protein